MRYFVFSSFLLASSLGCGDDSASSEPGANVTGRDLCASINKRSSACGEGTAELQDCTRNVEFLKCLYRPSFLPGYSACRGNTACNEKAGDDACVAKTASAVDPSRTARCEAKAKACEGADAWSAEFCIYPAFQPNSEKAMEDCVALVTCAEQRTCIGNFLGTLRSACPK